MTATISNQLCPDCGAPVPLAAPEGLCPRCLALAAVDSADQSTPGANTLAEQFAARRFFGDYELLGEVARGGMGIVFKARQLGVNRIVALKVLAGGAAAGHEFVHRFHNEAAAAARLEHPNIVPIYEFGEHEGAHFLAMRFLEGGTLQSHIATKLPSPADAARMIVTIANAVEHAHRRGVLHRDLKPGNVLLDAEGSPHVADFGLARLLEDDSSLTLSRAVIGTAAYLAPEVAGGGAARATTASDIYGLGAIFYELLTGRPPFAADSFPALLKKIAEQEPVGPAAAALRVISNQSSAPSALSAVAATDRRTKRTVSSRSVPSDLETICLKCLQKEPAKRYPTAQELADDLGRFLLNEPILARPVSRLERGWRWCQRKPALAGSLAAVSILLLAMLIGSPIAIYRITQARNAEAVQRQSAQIEATRAEAEELKARQARNAEATERQRAETETTRAEAEALKARQFAYASDMNRAHQAVQVDEFHEALQLLDHHRPEFVVPASAGSASDRSLARPDRLKAGLQTDLRGWEWRYLWRQCQGEERFILGKHTNGVSALGILPDGKTVFSAGSDKFVRLWDLEARRQIGALPHSAAIGGAAVSSDGRWLATATQKYGEGQPILLWDLATREIVATLATNFWLRPGGITFSPDKKWLAFATVFGGLRIWDVKARSEVTNLPALGQSLGVAFSPDSRTLAYNENDHGAILLWDTASRSMIDRLTGHESFVSALVFSPDGKTLASGSHDRTVKLWSLAERRVRSSVTNHSGAFTSLAFSPDGRTLAMSGSGGAGRVIRLIEIKTGEEKAQLRGHLEDVTSLAFTPDGQTLLSGSDDGTIRVWDVAPRAKEKSIHEFVRNSISLAWRSYGPALCLSPDGRHLLTVYTDQTFSLWDTLRLAEGKRHPLPFTDTTIAAVATGGRLAAFGSRSGELTLWDVETGQTRFFVRPSDTNRIHLLVFSRDGRYLAVADDAWTLSQMDVPEGTRRTVRVWDLSTHKEPRVFYTGVEFPVSLTFSADARVLMAGFRKGPVIWQLDRPGEAATFPMYSLWLRGLALLPDGQTFISAGTDIRFWDVQTRREKADKLNSRAGDYQCIVLSADGRQLAAGPSDGRITIWDIASHQEVATLEGHKESVTQLAFTPDGDHLVSVSKDQLRLWRASSSAEIEAAQKQARK